MSETPRTDQYHGNLLRNVGGYSYAGIVDLARQLETELMEMTAYAEKLADGLPMLPKDVENIQQANISFDAEVREYKRQVSTGELVPIEVVKNWLQKQEDCWTFPSCFVDSVDTCSLKNYGSLENQKKEG